MNEADVMSRNELCSQRMRLLGVFDQFTMAALRSDKKYRRLSRCRELIAYVMHDIQGFSYPEIGLAMAKDHTTILYAARRFRERQAGAK